MESSSQQQADPWAEIEQAALAAFGSHINLKAPGLVAVVRRSLRYAQIDSSAREIVCFEASRSTAIAVSCISAISGS